MVHNVSTLPNDPAIMQMQLPQQMGQHGFQAQFPVPVMGHIGPQIGQFGGFNTLAQLSGAGLAPGSIPLQGMNKQKQPSEFNFANVAIPESTHQKDQGVTVILFSSRVLFISFSYYYSLKFFYLAF